MRADIDNDFKSCQSIMAAFKLVEKRRIKGRINEGFKKIAEKGILYIYWFYCEGNYV